jgi:hypothetical protein
LVVPTNQEATVPLAKLGVGSFQYYDVPAAKRRGRTLSQKLYFFIAVSVAY